MSLAYYPYVPSWFDGYGNRKGTLALFLHMAEGTGTVGYLDKKGNMPPRGVSVNYVCQTDGTVVRMLPWDATSGSLNPNDRSTDKPYYGHEHLVDVLGEHWPDPNPWVISIEIEGFARTGPNGRQQKALVDWAADMVKRYPTIRGALGHADQTDTKGCPGMTSEMRAVFASIGGHGLWTPAEEEVTTVTIDRYPEPRKASGTNVTGYLLDGTALSQTSWDGLVSGEATIDSSHAPKGAGWVVGASRPFTGYYLPAASLTVEAPPPPDCSDKVAAELERAAVRARDAVLTA